MIRAKGSAKTVSDQELAKEKAIIKIWLSSAPVFEDVDGSTGSFGGNVVTSRNTEQPSRQSASWYTPEIAELRTASMAARRLYTRHRRKRNRDPEEEARLYTGYRERKRALTMAISLAKEKEKEELLKQSGEVPVQDDPVEIPSPGAADKGNSPSQIPAEDREELISPLSSGVS